MKWTGDDLSRLSLVDETGSVILGAVIRNPATRIWRAHDYVSQQGDGKDLGEFSGQTQAKAAVENSIAIGRIA
jgi:hypothetical protein